MSPYDCGSKRANIESVLGTNKWLWLIPVRTTNATGYEFFVHGGNSVTRAPETESLRPNSAGDEADTLGVVSTIRDLESAAPNIPESPSGDYRI